MSKELEHPGQRSGTLVHGQRVEQVDLAAQRGGAGIRKGLVSHHECVTGRNPELVARHLEIRGSGFFTPHSKERK
jgi:hypothetical protein